ncbi:MAG: hypothetical protein ACAI44_23330 [Candidatus Sericytochromatia bacterium]
MLQVNLKDHLLLGSWIVSLALLAIATLLGIAWQQNITLAYSQNKTSLVSTMRIELLKSLAAEKNAVIAARTETARHFAAQSSQAVEALERSRQQYAAIPQAEKSTSEHQAYQDFNTCWSQLRLLNTELLGLTVQNTNIQAQQLSNRESAQALANFEAALSGLLRADTSSAVSFHAQQALIAALKIQTLQMPHILSRQDPEMDALEASMQTEERSVHQHLAALDNTMAHGRTARARDAYQRFMALTGQILKLSRQNTNVHSAELELGKTQLLSTQCQESLAQLQATIQDQEFKATR